VAEAANKALGWY